jgi:hypothetical protein
MDITINKYVLNSLLFSLLPFIFLIFSIIVCLFLKCICAKYLKDSFYVKLIATNFVFIFLIYPTITNYTFGMFNCMEVEGINYLIRDFGIECWSSNHI